MKQDLQISNGEELYKNLLLVDPSAGQLDYKCRSDRTAGWNVLWFFFLVEHFSKLKQSNTVTCTGCIKYVEASKFIRSDDLKGPH